MERQPSLLELPFLFPFAKPAAGERGCATAGSKSRERDMLHLLSFNAGLCHSERQRKICSFHSFNVYPQEYHLHNQIVKIQTSLPLHFSRHVRMQPLFCALGGISSAHISTFSLTSAQGIFNSRSPWQLPYAHLPGCWVRSGRDIGLHMMNVHKSLIISAMKLKQMDSPLKKTDDCSVCLFVMC